MKTDYQKLNAFEQSAVILIIVGVMLVGTIIFSGLNIRQQNNFLYALDLFDSHEQAAFSMESIKLLLAMQHEFNRQFYIAFTQVAVLPDETFQVPVGYIQSAYNAIADYSDQISYDYKISNSHARQNEYSRRIAGAMVELIESSEITPPTTFPRKYLDPPESRIPYSFAPPEWQPIKNKLIKIWSQ